MSEAHLMKTLELKYPFCYGSNMCVCVCNILFTHREKGGIKWIFSNTELKEKPQNPSVFWNYQILHHCQMITFLISNVNNEICLLRT